MTPAQLQTLKTAILADNTLNAFPNNTDGAAGIAALLNTLAVPDFMVWRTEVPVANIFDAITWVNYTAADPPEATGIYTARAMAIQTKQMNLQNMLTGRATLDASKVNVRAGLRDAVVALPAGASGAAVSAGGASGATVLNACTRKALRIEKILTAGPQTTGTVAADVMGWEGQVSYQDVDQARNS